MCPGSPPTDLIDSIQTQTATGWSRRASSEGLRRYVQTIRERCKLIVLTVLVTTLAAAAVRGHRREDLRGRRPGSSSRPCRATTRRSTGLSPITCSSDPTRDVSTASSLVMTIDVARRAKENLQTDRTRALAAEGRHGGAARAEQPRGRDREGPQRRFGPEPRQHLRRRGDRRPHRQVHARPWTAHQGARAARADASTSCPGRRPTRCARSSADLRTLRAGGDPTMRVDTRADKPTSPSWPKTQAQHHRRHHRRARARRRRRVRRPDARPAPAPRGAAARALQAAGPGAHPGGEPRPRPRASWLRISFRPRASRPSAPCARRSARRAARAAAPAP